MTLKGLLLSDTDRELLERQLSISHPAELGATAAVIEPGLSVVRVEWTYNVTEAEPPLNEVWVDCAACRRRHNHKRGFVVLLSDGQFATVGLNCGQTKHTLEYREHLAVFDEERKRRRNLGRLLAAYARHDDVVAAIDTCRNDPGCRTLLERRRSFPRTFPSFWKLLNRNPDGVLYGQVVERDYDAEQLRDTRFDAKLDELARRRGLSRDDRDQEARLVAELADDPDASKAPITRLVRKATGHYSGVGFLGQILRVPDRLRDIRYQALHAFDDVDSKNTAAVSTARLDAARKRFAQVVSDQMKLQHDLAEAATFLDAANLVEIDRWIGRSRRRRASVGNLVVRDGTFHISGASMAIDVPQFIFASLLTEVFFEVTGMRNGTD